MNKELLKWEYEAYRRRTRNQRKLSKRNFVLAATVLALFAAVAALATQEEPSAPEDDILITEEEKPTEAQETPVTVIIEDEPVPVVESVPVPDEPELDKLPKMLNVTLTHYCVCEKCCGKSPDHPAYGITASGRKAEPYVSVAVDPIRIELGSKVYVDYGDGVIHEYRADDTGSGVNGTHIDLCVEDHQEALNLGVRKVTVWYEK